jgi:hypothetical protein
VEGDWSNYHVWRETLEEVIESYDPNDKLRSIGGMAIWLPIGLAVAAFLKYGSRAENRRKDKIQREAAIRAAEQDRATIAKLRAGALLDLDREVMDAMIVMLSTPPSQYRKFAKFWKQ